MLELFWERAGGLGKARAYVQRERRESGDPEEKLRVWKEENKLWQAFGLEQVTV